MATTSNMLIVKMTLGDDIRRFTANPATFNWAAAAKRAVEAFELASVHKFKMTYLDDEGDTVTLSSDEELSEAMSLALSSKPSVLRLTVHVLDKVEDRVEDKSSGSDKSSGADTKEAEDMTSIIDSIAKKLPTMMPALAEQLPAMMPAFAEQLPVMMCNAIGADAFVRPHHAGAKEHIHEGVSCDKSGMSPIVGNRYHLVGHNYDLCEAEYDKLDDNEKALFTKIPPPAVETAKTPTGFHPGVQCDRSGMVPIVGMRYKLKGQNYDLCQEEFDKLDDVEKAKFDAIPPPKMPSKMPWAGAWGAFGRGAGGPCRGGWARGGAFGKGHGGKGHGGKGHGGKGHGGKGCGDGDKLAARFICDVGFFDGTQVAPGTNFTKIWRIKNVGEVPWPAGTRMLFVGGDQMTTEMSVPIGRDVPVMPGEEVDVAVQMTAPMELGRYLGYWRLTGPHLRRKWGQRVWCHVQVVDPSLPANDVDIDSAVAELERMKSNLPAEDGEEDGADEAAAPAATSTSALASSLGSTSIASDKSGAVDGVVPMDDLPMPTAPEPVTVNEPAAPADGNANGKAIDKLPAESDASTCDEVVLVTDKMVIEAQPSAMAAAAEAPLTGTVSVKAALNAMGFVDDTMVDAVVAKHGEDLDACATDLAKATEWASLLNDLAEMGFENRELNKTLMLKNGGNIKRTVKDLVEA